MGTKAVGVFYMVRRLAGSLPDYLPDFVPRGLKEQISSIMTDNSEPANRVKFYDDWCDKYDEDLVIVGNYTGHIKCVEAFLKLGLDRKVSILDLAAGTGLLGAEVGSHGYECVDGLDASLGMLGQSRKQTIYQDYIVAMVDGLGSIPINDSTYDVVMSSNGFAPGQISLSASEIQSQLTSLKEAARARSPGELGRVDQVCQEFMDLKIPRHAEILDVAAGSGILSAEIQTGGYYNIDALDADLPTLQRLQALRLYRNYICRAVDGLMSTGLKEETYDVVITAGGFAQDAINPLDITEMLRLLRPEGILLWTMRTVSEEGTTEFGLLDANLRSLEKSGRCKVLKHNTFADPETKAVGVFYMARRLAGSL